MTSGDPSQPGPESRASMEEAEAAFLEYLHQKERNPELSLEEFCGQDSDVAGLVRNMASLWKLLEAEARGCGASSP